VQQYFDVNQIRVVASGTSSPIDPADILTRPRADLPFAQQAGYGAQVLGRDYSVTEIPEPGVMGPDGQLRLGKAADPAQAGTVLKVQVAPNDPLTHAEKRAEFAGASVIEFNKIYWIALRVYVADWGSGADGGGLFGAQVHSGDNSHNLSSTFALYTGSDRRTFEVRTVYSPDPPSSGTQLVTRYAVNTPIGFGRWVDYVFKFRHNTSGAGFLQVWMDGMQIVSHQGNLGFNTGLNDYAKFGYYNFSVDAFVASNTTRNVWLKNPVVVADPTAKYTQDQLRTFINQ
jgi:hypothetical protein